MARTVVVVGAGITGTALACELAARGARVTSVDRDGPSPRGSTAFAPGFVGLYNDAPVLTALAADSAAVYDGAGGGFERRGGLELATSPAGVHELERRVAAAREAGLRADVLAPEQLPASVSGVVDTPQVLAAGSFPDDGVAVPVLLSAALRARAAALGVVTAAAEVVAVDTSRAGASVRTATGEVLMADDVVLAAGVWGPHLAALTGMTLPLVPVAHPYAYSAPRAGLLPGPFVRWPEHHVYARVHGDRLGIGSYDHAPVPVEQPELVDGAGLVWRDDFDDVVADAQRLLPPGARVTPQERVNGVFAMTPDNLPFLGPHPHLARTWVAQALWVTHAAGAARALAAAMNSDEALPEELAVGRFDGSGRTPAELRAAALRLYRDIYANDADDALATG